MSQTTLGILFALGALFCWGFGDFLIQRTTRAVGPWKSLFYISALGAMVFLPFVWNDIHRFFSEPYGWGSALLASVVGLVAAILDFKALEDGKIAVIEPIMGLEVVFTVLLSIFLWGEHLTVFQGLCIVLVFVGVVLTGIPHISHLLHVHKRIFERGGVLAFWGAVAMASTNFMVGVSSQETSPLFIIWFWSAFLTVATLVYLGVKGEMRVMVRETRRFWKPILGESLFDNAAWVSFAYAATRIPIAITTTISENFIIVAVLLGVVLNRERLKRHQVVGVTLAILGVVILSAITK